MLMKGEDRNALIKHLGRPGSVSVLSGEHLVGVGAVFLILNISKLNHKKV